MDFLSMCLGYFLGWVANRLFQRYGTGRHKYGRAFLRKSKPKQLESRRGRSIQDVVSSPGVVIRGSVAGNNSVIVGGNMIINNHSPRVQPEIVGSDYPQAPEPPPWLGKKLDE